MVKPILINGSFPYREYIYKNDKIVEYASNDFVGFYLDTNCEIKTTKRCQTMGDVIYELDTRNTISDKIKLLNTK